MNFFFFNLMEDFRQFWRKLSGQNAGSGETRRLYVGNLSYQVKEQELKSFFSKSVRVANVQLIRDRFTRRPKGYAFIEVSKDDTQKALAFSGVDFLGRKLVVSEAKSKNSASGGGARRAHHQGQGGGRDRSSNRFRKRPMKGPRQYRGGNSASSTSETPIERLE